MVSIYKPNSGFIPTRRTVKKFYAFLLLLWECPYCKLHFELLADAESCRDTCYKEYVSKLGFDPEKAMKAKRTLPNPERVKRHAEIRRAKSENTNI